MNKYPIYVISKDRHDCCYTADFLIKDKVPFKLVIEPHQFDLYVKKYDKKYILCLPFKDLGLGSIPARNWVWDHAIETGAERHWILDDNIRYIMRTYKGKRIRCSSIPAFKSLEDFTDRYENIAISGLNYSMFVVGANKPFYHNVHVYSFMCIKNNIKQRWRGRYNEDTDLCLQVLAGGLCTILLNVFCCYKITTGIMKGGNATSLYKGDGRLTMANSLKRLWPGVVSVNRRFQRPQHIIAKTWAGFDTPLIKKKNIIILEKNEYGLKLIAKNPIKSKRLQKIVNDYKSNQE